MTIKAPSNRLLTVSTALSTLSLPLCVQAAFIDDAKGSLELRNFHYIRDFRDEQPSQSKRNEWAQGFILNLKSGYTEGAVGFGLEATGMLGLKLDSSPDRTSTGLLPRHDDGSAPDSYGKAGLTGKARLGESELRVGTLSPAQPLLRSNDGRLFTQLFEGAELVSRDLDRTTLTLGWLESVKQRNSSDSEDLSMMRLHGTYTIPSGQGSDHFAYAGVSYAASPNVTLQYQYGVLKNFFRKDFLGVTASTALGPGKLFAEARYFDSREDGRQFAGEVDNRTLSSNIGYSWAGHTFSGGYQKAWGDTAFAYVDGTDTYLYSEMLASPFTMPNERVFHARYDFDFAALGIPGLRFNWRYVKGDQVDVATLTTREARGLSLRGKYGRERESGIDLSYAIQSGALKGAGIRWRSSVMHSSYANDADESRLTLTYNIAF
ncbi:OprD family porin [Pseudomonas sp. LRF_L74]|uniref:OprD family porin n=1 Tax=Pseudomonas sp. LRF_L74 TaxID=3369422 RepID=UPI003F5EBD45